jgi:hypothetical protein
MIGYRVNLVDGGGKELGNKGTPQSGGSEGGPMTQSHQKSPVIGAADHLYNNAIGQCTETQYIYSAQITPSTRTFLDG